MKKITSFVNKNYGWFLIGSFMWAMWSLLYIHIGDKTITYIIPAQSASIGHKIILSNVHEILIYCPFVLLIIFMLFNTIIEKIKK